MGVADYAKDLVTQDLMANYIHVRAVSVHKSHVETNAARAEANVQTKLRIRYVLIIN